MRTSTAVNRFINDEKLTPRLEFEFKSSIIISITADKLNRFIK